MTRLRPILIIMLGLMAFAVSTAIPVVHVDGRSTQGWEAAEISVRFLFKDFPKVPMSDAAMLDPAAGLSILGIGKPRLPKRASAMDGVMVSTGILAAGGFQTGGVIGKVFLYWVAWAWLANLGVIMALIVLLVGRRGIQSVRRLIEIVAWISVLLAAIGSVLVLGWGNEPLLFGPSYWVWLASLIIMAIGPLFMTASGRRRAATT